MDNGWCYDGKYLQNKCLDGVEDCDKSKTQKRFRCVQFDQDLSEKYMNKYYDHKYIKN